MPVPNVLDWWSVAHWLVKSEYISCSLLFFVAALEALGRDFAGLAASLRRTH